MKFSLHRHAYRRAHQKSHIPYALVAGTFLLSIGLIAIACSTTAPEVAPKAEPAATTPEPQVAVAIPEPPAEEAASPEVTAAEVAPPAVAPSATAPATTWQLVLVNEKNPLPADFAVDTKNLANGKAFDSRAIGALEGMLAAAAKDDIVLQVCSSYRTISYQAGLFDRKVDHYVAQGHSKDEAYAIAKTIVAIAGTSEHNLGLAADIVTPTYQTLDSGFDQTPAFSWLHEHAAEYGFILRYPNGKGDITGIIYEPWHYRYVGVDAADEITARGICLEEYLDRL